MTAGAADPSALLSDATINWPLASPKETRGAEVTAATRRRTGRVSRQVRFAHEASAELEDGARWYEHRHAGLGLAFLGRRCDRRVPLSRGREVPGGVADPKPWLIHFFQRAGRDDPARAVPAVEFLDGLPVKVRARSTPSSMPWRQLPRPPSREGASGR